LQVAQILRAKRAQDDKTSQEALLSGRCIGHAACNRSISRYDGGVQIFQRVRGATFRDESGQASQTADEAGDIMAQNHYVTKTKRRPKNSNRKDSSAATMAKLRELAAADTKKASK
jgi:hypothetical protein